MTELRVTTVKRLAYITNLSFGMASEIYDSTGKDEIEFMKVNTVLKNNNISVEDAIDVVMVAKRLEEAASE